MSLTFILWEGLEIILFLTMSKKEHVALFSNKQSVEIALILFSRCKNSSGEHRMRATRRVICVQLEKRPLTVLDRFAACQPTLSCYTKRLPPLS